MRMTRQLTTGRPLFWAVGPGVLGAVVVGAIVALAGAEWPVAVASGAVALVVIAAFLAMIWPRFLARHRLADAVERAFGVPILIELPRLATAKQNPPIMLTEVGTDVEAADAYRRLRSKLSRLASLTQDEIDGAPVVLITATPDTSADERLALASNLALVAADTERRVVLVEADLLAPALNRLLAMAPVPGLADAVGRGPRRADGSFDTRQLVQATERGQLSVVSHGNPVRRAGDVLSRLDAFFATLRADNDLVVIHGPSTDRVDEVVELLSYADQVVVSAGPDADVDQVRQLRRLVEQMAAPLVGVALSCRRTAAAAWTPAERPMMVPPAVNSGLVGAPSAPDVPLAPVTDAQAPPSPGAPSVFDEMPAPGRVWEELGDLLSGPERASQAPTPAVSDSGPISVDEALAVADIPPASIGANDATREVPVVAIDEAAQAEVAPQPTPEPEAAGPEAAVSEATGPEATGPEAAVPEAAVSGAEAPDMSVPDVPPEPAVAAETQTPPEVVSPVGALFRSEPNGSDPLLIEATDQALDATIRIPPAPVAGGPPLPPASLADMPPPAVPDATVPETAMPPIPKLGVNIEADVEPEPELEPEAAVEVDADVDQVDPTVQLQRSSDAENRQADAGPGVDAEPETDAETEANPEASVGVVDAGALADEVDAIPAAVDLTVLDDVQFDLLAELEDEDDFNPSRR